MGLTSDPSAGRPHIIDAELDAVAIVKAVLANDQDAFTAIAGGLHEVRDGALYYHHEGYLIWTLAGWLLNVMHERYGGQVRHAQDVRDSVHRGEVGADLDARQHRLLVKHGLESCDACNGEQHE